jgi:hypothetical protein
LEQRFRELLFDLCHNNLALVDAVVHQSHIEVGIEPVFWKDEPAKKEDPSILRFVQSG